MKKENWEHGEIVKVSWKEDEGGGWYSNQRQKRGVIHKQGTEFWIVTDINPQVNPSDVTAIHKSNN